MVNEIQLMNSQHCKYTALAEQKTTTAKREEKKKRTKESGKKNIHSECKESVFI